MTDPFKHVVDEPAVDGLTMRTRLLESARRGFAPLRKTFVQRPNTEKVRRSVLADLVTSKQERPLDVLLLLHGLEPVLTGSPLPLRSWATMLPRGKAPTTTTVVSKAFDALVARGLITRDGSRPPVVAPLLEDGSGHAWTRPGLDPATVGTGYFAVPYDYWTTGLADRLGLPGKAMFLIMLSETSQHTTFAMAVARAPAWYGISERTAERGYRELRDQNVLLERKQVVNDPRSSTGLRAIYHRALASPYSTDARTQLQSKTRKAARARAGRAAAIRTDTETTRGVTENTGSLVDAT